MPDIEFEFGHPNVDGNPPDALDAGRKLRRMPPTGWVALGIAILVLVVGVDLARGHHKPAATTSPVVATPTPSASPTGDLLSQLTPLAFGALAPAELRSTSFGCPKELVAFPPTPNQLAALARAFPAFAQVQSRPVIDGSNGLCAIELRSSDDVGDVLIVIVTAPPNPQRPVTSQQQDEVPLQTDYFRGTDYTSSAGFHVQVGLFSLADPAPTTPDQLTQLAMDAGLTW